MGANSLRAYNYDEQDLNAVKRIEFKPKEQSSEVTLDYILHKSKMDKKEELGENPEKCYKKTLEQLNLNEEQKMEAKESNYIYKKIKENPILSILVTIVCMLIIGYFTHYVPFNVDIAEIKKDILSIQEDTDKISNIETKIINIEKNMITKKDLENYLSKKEYENIKLKEENKRLKDINIKKQNP